MYKGLTLYILECYSCVDPQPRLLCVKDSAACDKMAGNQISDHEMKVVKLVMNVAALVNWYYTTRSYAALRPNSVRSYRHLLTKLLVILEDKVPITRIKAREADYIFGMLSSAYGMHCAVSTCRILSHIWKLGIRYEKVKFNPFQNMEHPQLTKRTQFWATADLLRFIQTCDNSGFGSLGLLAELCYVFGQRPGDMRKLLWKNIHGKVLEFVQEKTDAFISVQIPTYLRTKLAQIEIESTSLFICINPNTNLPYTSRDYNKLTFDMKRKAHVPIELQLRDLRRTALTESGQFGSDVALRGLGGHKSGYNLDIYRLNRSEQTRKMMEQRFRNHPLTRRLKS